MQEIQLSEMIVLLIALFLFSILTYKKNSLDLEGILIGNILGIVVFLLGGLISFSILVLFFIIAELGTRFGRIKRAKHEVRTTGNILGNSAAAVAMLVAGSTLGFYAGISAALADTLSSEIGITSKRKPVLITSWKEVETGTDGAVSVRGLIAAVLGASIVGLAYFVQFQSSTAFIVIVIAGFAGSITDSFLGAIFERSGKLNNTWVNFLGSLTGSLIGLIAGIFLII
ncbi:MAG: DUF92 domain-containing protein [Candidatus Diapherotrites archaeon]|nr:DUF92 domain-containing protein [Candidatus Diapherotrites archaeon]